MKKLIALIVVSLGIQMCTAQGGKGSDCAQDRYPDPGDIEMVSSAKDGTKPTSNYIPQIIPWEYVKPLPGDKYLVTHPDWKNPCDTRIDTIADTEHLVDSTREYLKNHPNRAGEYTLLIILKVTSGIPDKFWGMCRPSHSGHE